MSTDVLETRVTNLKALVIQWGGPTSLAKKLAFSGPSFVSQMVGGIRPVTEKTARKIETKLGLAMGWMDAVHDNGGAPLRVANVDDTLMVRAIGLVAAKMHEANLQVQTDKFGELVSLVYGEAARSGGNLDEMFVERLVQLMK